MSNSERALIIFSEDTDSMESLQHALNAIRHPPVKNSGTYDKNVKPVPYTEAEVDAYVIAELRKAAPLLTWGGSVIVP